MRRTCVGVAIGVLTVLSEPGGAVSRGDTPPATPAPQVPQPKLGEEKTATVAFQSGVEYRFHWTIGDKKAGETRMTVSEVELPGVPGKVRRSKSSYRVERDGTRVEGEHETDFDRTWRPLRFRSLLRTHGVND